MSYTHLLWITYMMHPICMFEGCRTSFVLRFSIALSQIIVELFDLIGGPVEVDLVRMVGYLPNVRHDRIESLTEQAAARWDAHLSVVPDTIWSASRDGFDG